MKKIFKFAMMFAAALTLTASMVACGDDKNDDPQPTPVDPVEIDVNNADDLDYNEAYAEQWANYMMTVSGLLSDDASRLYSEWQNGYADIFKNHNSDEYKSAIECVEQIFDGCIDIAGEVGDQKIGEPYRLYQAGNREEALRSGILVQLALS